MSDNLLLLSPLVAPLVGGVLSLLADAFGMRRVAVGSSVGGLVAGAGLGFFVSDAFAEQLLFDVMLAGGTYSAIVGTMLAVCVIPVAGGWSWFTRSEMGGGAAALVALLSVSAAALAGSVDLLLTIIALEALAVSGYALTAQARTARAAEASVKYVVQGSVAAGLVILGFAVFIGTYGTRTGLADIGSALGFGPIQPAIIASVLVLAAFSYKLGAFPFHSWAPDVFENAPPASAGVMATVPKIAAVSAVVILWDLTVGNVPNDRLPWLIVGISAGSIIVGNLVALRQTSYTRMLGYSGIAQIGYVLVAIAAPQYPLAPSAALLLVAGYGLAAAAAFVGAVVVQTQRPAWDGSISGMAGLGRARPVFGVSMAVAMFSLTGIPIAVGFWGKFGVFGAALSAGSNVLTALAIVGILGSVVSFGYYGAVLRSLFFDEPVTANAVSETEVTSSRAAEGVLALSAAVMVGLGVAPLFTGVVWLLEMFAPPLLS